MRRLLIAIWLVLVPLAPAMADVRLSIRKMPMLPINPPVPPVYKLFLPRVSKSGTGLNKMYLPALYR